MDDAFYSLNLEPIRRSDGRDSVAAVAYILGARVRNDARPHGYSNFSQQRDRVIATGRTMPDDAPDWAQDIGTVWNRNEKVNNRSNSQLGQRIIVALPHEIKSAKRVEVVAEFAAYLVQSYGVLVEYALHVDEGENNPHAHMIFTDRMITAEGFGAKVREFAKKKFYYEIRDKWAELGNAALAASGASKRLSSKSYKARGIEKTPTLHRGIGAHISDVSQVLETQQEREDSMGRKPNRMERFNYPNIAHLDFPPRIEDAETDLQRDEVERFYLNKGEPVPCPDDQVDRGEYRSMSEAPEHIQREYNQHHLDVLDAFGDRDYEDGEYFETRPDRAYLAALRSQQAEQEYDELRSRARNLYISMTPQEKRVMAQVKDAPRDVQDYYKEQIVLARMKELQARDFEHRRRELEKVIIRTNRQHEKQERAEAFKEANRELKDLPRAYASNREVDMVRDEEHLQGKWGARNGQNLHLEMKEDEPDRER